MMKHSARCTVLCVIALVISHCSLAWAVTVEKSHGGSVEESGAKFLKGHGRLAGEQSTSGEAIQAVDDDDDSTDEKDDKDDKGRTAEKDDNVETEEEVDDLDEEADTGNQKESSKVTEARKELKKVKEQNARAESVLDMVNGDKDFEGKLRAGNLKIANETASQGLADFLVDLRSEVRSYALPSILASSLVLEKHEKNREKNLRNQLDKLRKKHEAQAKDVKKEDKKEHQEDEEDKPFLDDDAEKAGPGQVFAISFMGSIALLSVTFSLVNSKNSKLRNYTLVIVDNVVAILLAVMYFQAVDSYFRMHELEGASASVAAILHAVLYLAGALIIAALFTLFGANIIRDSEKRDVALSIFCGAGAHVVSFTSIHAAAKTQNSVWMKEWYTAWSCLTGLVVLALAIAGIGFVVYKIKKAAGLTENDKFMDRTDDLENDFSAMGFSVCFTMFIRYLITGHHPVDDETEFDHTSTQRALMLVYGVVMLAVAAPMVAWCTRVETQYAGSDNKYLVKRVMTFIGSTATLNVAWAFLYWGEWEFFGHLFKDQNEILGKLIWALVASMGGCAGLFLLAKLTGDKGTRLTTIALAAIGLVVAFSWENCFDEAVESLAKGHANEAHAKMAATIVMAAFLLPMYAVYMKPLTMPASEEING